MNKKYFVQEIFPALASTSNSDWQQVSKKKSREPFDPNAPSAGGAWVRAAGTPTKPAPSAAVSEPPTTAGTCQTDRPPSHERQNRSKTASLTVLLRRRVGPTTLFALCFLLKRLQSTLPLLTSAALVVQQTVHQSWSCELHAATCLSDIAHHQQG